MGRNWNDYGNTIFFITVLVAHCYGTEERFLGTPDVSLMFTIELCIIQIFPLFFLSFVFWYTGTVNHKNGNIYTVYCKIDNICNQKPAPDCQEKKNEKGDFLLSKMGADTQRQTERKKTRSQQTVILNRLTHQMKDKLRILL